MIYITLSQVGRSHFKIEDKISKKKNKSKLGIIREANDEESYMMLHIPGKAVRYNLNVKTFSGLMLAVGLNL